MICHPMIKKQLSEADFARSKVQNELMGISVGNLKSDHSETEQ